MKTISFSISLLLITMFMIAGCSKLSDELLPANNGTVKAAHPQGWTDSASAAFHGRFLKSSDWDLGQCQSCHGATFQGGTSQQSCFTCHPPYPHPDLWDTTFTGFRSSDHFHGTYLRMNDWKLPQCQACHGFSYNGGRVSFSCENSGCHVDRNGAPKPPESCNTCHGDFRGVATDTLSWAPPRAVNGDTVETSAGVGAHQAHLAEGEISELIRCNDCHAVPSAFGSPGHIGTTGRAALVFSSRLAALPSADNTFVPVPAYNTSTMKCGNVFCHGDWRATSTNALDNSAYIDSVISGNNYSPHWTGGGDEIACGTCHNLPPVGHIDVGDRTSCGNCHTGVVDAAGNIDTLTGKSLHINGKIDVFGLERNF